MKGKQKNRKPILQEILSLSLLFSFFPFLSFLSLSLVFSFLFFSPSFYSFDPSLWSLVESKSKTLEGFNSRKCHSDRIKRMKGKQKIQKENTTLSLSSSLSLSFFSFFPLLHFILLILSLWIFVLLLSVPGDSVHGFQPVTDKRDVAICIIWKTEIDIYSLSLTLLRCSIRNNRV